VIAFYLDSFQIKDRKNLDDLNLAQIELRLECLCNIGYRAVQISWLWSVTKCEYGSGKGGGSCGPTTTKRRVISGLE
jgi:lysozyme family protein